MNPPESFIFYYVILNIRCENVICLEELRPQILSMFNYPSSMVSQYSLIEIGNVTKTTNIRNYFFQGFLPKQF